MKDQSSICEICKKKSPTPLCSYCIKNPFRVEKYRDFLARNKNYTELSKWYKKNLPEIPNLNTPKFWDKKLKINEALAHQDGMTRNRIKITSSLLSIRAERILDIGAGHGYLEEYLSKQKRLKIYANDFSKESVEHLMERFNGDFKVQSIYKLDYKQKSFDAVFTLEVLEHIPPSKVLSVLQNIKKLLKKNGQFILSVPTNEGLENMTINNNGHTRLYTVPLITAELRVAGFKVEAIKTLYAFDKYYILKYLVSKILKNKWQPNNIIISSRV